MNDNEKRLDELFVEQHEAKAKGLLIGGVILLLLLAAGFLFN